MSSAEAIMGASLILAGCTWEHACEELGIVDNRFELHGYKFKVEEKGPTFHITLDT